MLINYPSCCRYWLFGEKIQPEGTSSIDRIRGWFPRNCANEMAEDGTMSSPELVKRKKVK